MQQESIELASWDAVSDYIDNGFYVPAPSYFEHVIQHRNYYPANAFSKGQLASKSWLLEQLVKANRNTGGAAVTIAILGSWIGTLVQPLIHCTNVKRVYGFDMDADAIEKSEKLNQMHVQDGWRYKGVVADVSQLDCSAMQFETGGELIEVKPDIIINTSCEHMNTDWFDTVSSDQLIVMQTNNSEDYEGHINTCISLAEVQSKYTLDHRRTHYCGEMITPAYTRYMQIGYKP
tara:strand:+ start:210 stop:908 length:699 start_codon:yes stop_codon:yes gene_type:complete